MLAGDFWKVPNKPELKLNWVDYLQLLQASQSDVRFSAGCIHIFSEQELVWKMQHRITKRLGRLL